MYFFSKSTRGFYDSETHGKNMPADAKEVPAELRSNLLAGQKEGFRIEGDEDGLPILVAVQKSPEELAAQARIKRAALLASCDWTVLPDAPLDEAKRTEWTAYRQALRDITSQDGFPGNVDWPAVPK